jgi:Ser/Thr protein kinase RdoA (MazF antagonist)
MIHIPPFDPILPNFPTLFDGEAMRGLIARHAARNAGVEIIACRPTYVRYKPQTSCLVNYDIDIRIGNEVTTHPAHIKTFADDRGRRRMQSRKLAKLLDRANDECGAFPLERVAYVPELNGMLAFFPIDYDLRSLLPAAATEPARKHLATMLDAPDLTVASDPALIRYKPGRKALFRYETSRGVVYGKTHADKPVEMIRAATTTLIEAGLPTPEMLGTNEKLGYIAHAEAPGDQLASLRDDARFESLLAALAEPLSLLHRTPVQDLPVHHLGHEVDRLRETARLLGVILPELETRLKRIVCVLEDRLARVDDELATNHGDFYDDQAIVNGDRMVIIDLDEIRIAHPMLDIGNMLAHLLTGQQRGSVRPRAREAFIAAMRQHREMSDRDIAAFEAIGILKLAPGPFRRLEAAWPERIEEMLALIERVLGCPVLPDTRSGVQPSSIADDKLPELPALQDVARMQATLRDATGDQSLNLTRIHLQRHKPGRRAILRYDVEGSAPIWGKIFASKRGPRVHEITRKICDVRAFGPDVALPDPIAFVTDLRVLLQRSVPGRSIDERLFAGDEGLVTNIAEAIHALHASGLDLGREHDLDKELSPLPQRVEDVGEMFPDLREASTDVHARLRDLAGNIEGWRSLPIHRDFYHDQVLADGHRLSVLDLDDAAMSEPAIDIANFAAHLDLLALQQPAHAGGIARARDRFLSRSRELDPQLNEALLSFLIAATHLRLAGIHAPRERGHHLASGLLAEATGTMGAGHR